MITEPSSTTCRTKEKVIMSHYESATYTTPALFERKGGWGALGSRGFTLIELMAVLAILTALTFIAIPAYSKIKDRVRVVRTMEEVRGLEKAINAYAIDHGSAWPPNLDALLIPIPADPWGNGYVYHLINGVTPDPAARIDAASAQLNDDFDLYSKGVNGECDPANPEDPKCDDDIVRSGNGGSVGLASYP